MSERLHIPAEGVMGMLRQGVESVVFTASPEGHVHGKRIVIESVDIQYRLEERAVPDPGRFLDPAGGC